MMRSMAVVVVPLVVAWLGAAQPSAQPVAQTASAAGLVSTWTLNTFQRGPDPGTRVANPRGLLVFDAAGHAFEFVTSPATQRMAGGPIPIEQAQTTFNGYGGFWGAFRVDDARRTITFRPESGISPLLTASREFSRTFDCQVIA